MPSGGLHKDCVPKPNVLYRVSALGPHARTRTSTYVYLQLEPPTQRTQCNIHKNGSSSWIRPWEDMGRGTCAGLSPRNMVSFRRNTSVLSIWLRRRGLQRKRSSKCCDFKLAQANTLFGLEVCLPCTSPCFTCTAGLAAHS